MATVKYNNGVGKNNQYPFRLYDNITDPTKNSRDILVSPDEITWFYKNDGISKEIKMTLPGEDNLYLQGNVLTTNTTIIG
jgi:hypothetical protein